MPFPHLSLPLPSSSCQAFLPAPLLIIHCVSCSVRAWGEKGKTQTPSRALFPCFPFPLHFVVAVINISHFHAVALRLFPHLNLFNLFPCDHADWPPLLSYAGEGGRRDAVSRRRWLLVGARGWSPCPLQRHHIRRGDRPGELLPLCPWTSQHLGQPRCLITLQVDKGMIFSRWD